MRGSLGVRGKGDTDAHCAGEFLITNAKWLTTRSSDPLAELDGLVFIWEPFRHDHELVTTNPSQCVGRAEVTKESFGHLQQHRVADAVAKRVIDHLEPVEVNVE